MKIKKIKTKNNTGITLIALVVTIIVLLILAGVSLSLVAGSNGIIGKAEKALTETQKAALKEEAELAIAELQMEYYEERGSGQTFINFVKEKCPIETATGKVERKDGKLTYIGNNGEIKLSEDNGKLVPGEVENAGGTTAPEVKKYTVRYNSNGGEGSVSENLSNVAQGTQVNVDTTAVLTKSGCTFLGWALTSNATEAILNFEMPNNDVTLYAVWHTHNYVATELKDCSNEIKNNYNFKDVEVECSRWGNETITYYNGATVGDIVFVKEDSEYKEYGYICHAGYHEITALVGGGTYGANTTLLGENYLIKVCSCGDYYKE